MNRSDRREKDSRSQHRHLESRGRGVLLVRQGGECEEPMRFMRQQMKSFQPLMQAFRLMRTTTSLLIKLMTGACDLIDPLSHLLHTLRESRRGNLLYARCQFALSQSTIIWFRLLQTDATSLSLKGPLQVPICRELN